MIFLEFFVVDSHYYVTSTKSREMFYIICFSLVLPRHQVLRLTVIEKIILFSLADLNVVN